MVAAVLLVDRDMFTWQKDLKLLNSQNLLRPGRPKAPWGPKALWAGAEGPLGWGRRPPEGGQRPPGGGRI